MKILLKTDLELFIETIKKLRPNSQWSLIGENYEGLNWISEDIEKPTKDELLLEFEKTKEEYKNKEYQRLRAVEYPSLVDQLDMQYWDKINGTTIWQDTIQAIKDKYPKPEVI